MDTPTQQKGIPVLRFVLRAAIQWRRGNATLLRAALPCMCMIVFAAAWVFFHLGLWIPDDSVKLQEGRWSHVERAKEMVMRITWANSLILLTCTNVLVICVGSARFLRSSRIPGEGSIDKKLLLLIIVSVLLWAVTYGTGLSGGIGTELYRIASARVALELGPQAIMKVVMANCFVGIWCVFLGCSAICEAASSGSWARHLRIWHGYRTLLICTAAFFCAGMLQTFLLYQWLAIFVSKGTGPVISSGMTIGIGFFFSIFFTALFLPVYYLLRLSAIRDASIEIGSDEEKAVRDHLHEHGMSFSAKGQMNNLGILASPFVVGLVADFISRMV